MPRPVSLESRKSSEPWVSATHAALWENPMTEYTIVIEKDEDGYYVGSVPGLPGCHTQGKSIDQLFERMQEAISLWLEVVFDDAEARQNRDD